MISIPTLADLRACRPEDNVRATYDRIRTFCDPALFITLRDEADVLAEAARLPEGNPHQLPLFGIPVAVKDNIDVAGLRTTAACPAYAYVARQDATAVARLRAAGAIVIGKTNLDQFATGLVGVRSPYGIPRNPIKPDLIPGGSSSGSATAVSAGIVPISLGTDTAGSGRVPAMLNNIVGLKPSLGLVSTRGVVPACRTLDCISIFALSVDDAACVLDVIGEWDADDPYSRHRKVLAPGAFPPGLRLGVPRPGQLKFFDDHLAEAAHEAALARLEKLGAKLVPFDIEPYYETARLLYEGPWVAERYLVAKDLIARDPAALHPVTLAITQNGAKPSAADTFAALYRLQALRRVHEQTFQSIDAMVLPTAPTAYTVDQVIANPIEFNSRLGTYTNFVNLLDMSGLAIPAAMRDDGIPYGITLLARGGEDALLASIGRVFHADTGLKAGATGLPLPPLAPRVPEPRGDEIPLVVVGAHLSGMALNHEMLALGARLIAATQTTPDYKLYALAGGPPARPGMVRVGDGEGTAIAVEVWGLTPDSFGRFVASIPAPLSIGTVRLADGQMAKGFLAEPAGLDGARDISSLGGWRAYVAAK